MTIAGIDVGTTGCKCTLYTVEGEFVKEAYREYDIVKFDGKSELDAKMVWENVQEVIAETLCGRNDLKAIGVTSFGESVVFLDENDEPLINSLLYIDPRGDDQCSRLVEALGERNIAKITGVKPHHMYSIPKIMWVKENMPEVYAKTNGIMVYQQYISYMLSGVSQIDYSLAARTLGFDVNTLEWSDEIFAAADVDKNLLGKTVKTGSRCGKIKAELAKKWDLNDEVEIVTGCQDQVAAAVGCAIFEQGMAVDGTGTVECITPMFNKLPENDVMFEDSFSVVPYVIGNSYVTYAYSFNGGSMLKWYRDNLAKFEATHLKNEGKNPYVEFEKDLDDEPTGILVLPYFSGCATPYMDSQATGAILGLTAETDTRDIYKALMEGVTFEMLLNLQELNRAGILVDKLVATGGGANSRLWLQMKADILNKEIISLGAAQSGTLGCIMMSGVACGIYDSFAAAANVFVKEKDRFYPRKEKHEQYMKLFNKYKKIYKMTKEIWEED